MWSVNGTPVSGAWLNPEPVRVLYDIDGPRIFICEDTKGDSFLAYQCGEDESVSRFLVVPFDSEWERQLTSGDINLRDALSRLRAWIIDLGRDWEIQSAWRVDVDRLPQAVLPRPGVMLWRHLTPTVSRWLPRSGSSETEVPAPDFGIPGGRRVLVGLTHA